MKTEKTIIGVIAEYNGMYWGEIGHGANGFIEDIDKAEISDPEFCKKATDKTSVYNKYDYNQLSKAKLITIKKTIITEYEFI